MSTGNKYNKWDNGGYDKSSSQQYKKEFWNNGLVSLEHANTQKNSKNLKTSSQQSQMMNMGDGSEDQSVSSTIPVKQYYNVGGKGGNYVIFIQETQEKAEGNYEYYKQPKFVRKDAKTKDKIDASEQPSVSPSIKSGALPSNRRSDYRHYQPSYSVTENPVGVNYAKYAGSAETTLKENKGLYRVKVIAEHGPKYFDSHGESPQELASKICNEGKIEDKALSDAIAYFIGKSTNTLYQQANEYPHCYASPYYPPSMPQPGSFINPPY